MRSSQLLSRSFVFILSYFMTVTYAEVVQDHKDYCVQKGGVVEEMAVEIQDASGWTLGHSKLFCNFHVNHGFLAIGLETFASDKPSIAATLAKRLDNIKMTSSLWNGSYKNPSHNVCINLGGSTLGYYTSGGFANELGQTDVCVFGDASMISGWSLIYMANHREGYDAIQHAIKAEPLSIPLPMN